jgi:capsular exopolysaccharide synthesis family protein
MRRFLLHSHSSSAGRFSRVVPSRALIDRPHSPESEAIGVLRTSLFLQRSLPTTARVLLVTSPLPGEGKTTVAANLAAAIAKHHKVCLVDCDMRRPSAASAFRIPPSKALQHLLRGQVSLAEVLYPVPGVENLSLLASWTPVEDASELITLENISALLNDLRERFEYIVIDTPPVLPYSEGRLLATAAEGIILVTRSASTPRSAIRRTIEVLSELRCAPILSVVLNGADFSCADNRYCYGYR